MLDYLCVETQSGHIECTSGEICAVLDYLCVETQSGLVECTSGELCAVLDYLCVETQSGLGSTKNHNVGSQPG